MNVRALSTRVGKKLKARELSIAVAESCSGGEIAHELTNIPGSSDYFTGGLVAYSNRVKQTLLKVPKPVLSKQGAVSRQTALRMAKGARKLFQSDVALATTGIAGPSGGTRAKPAGLVFISITDGKRIECHRKVFKGARLQIKKKTTETALKLLKKFI